LIGSPLGCEREIGKRRVSWREVVKKFIQLKILCSFGCCLEGAETKDKLIKEKEFKMEEINSKRGGK